MDLRLFLEVADISDEVFAERVGVKRTTVNRWKNGTLRPGWRMMNRIRRVTRDAVMPNDFAYEVPKIARPVGRPRKHVGRNHLISI